MSSRCTAATISAGSTRSRAAASSCAPRSLDRLLRTDRLVLDAVRLVRVGAEAALAVGFVVLEVAFEPLDVRVAFESEDVRRDAIEEPAIVADHDGAARELFEAVLERA